MHMLHLQNTADSYSDTSLLLSPTKTNMLVLLRTSFISEQMKNLSQFWAISTCHYQISFQKIDIKFSVFWNTTLCQNNILTDAIDKNISHELSAWMHFIFTLSSTPLKVKERSKSPGQFLENNLGFVVILYAQTDRATSRQKEKCY